MNVFTLALPHKIPSLFSSFSTNLPGPTGVLEFTSLSRVSYILFQDLFFHIHPVHFLNSRAHGIGVGRSQSPTRERDSIFGFSTGSRRVKELPANSGEVPIPWEQNMYVSEPSTDGYLEHLLEHAQDVSLWVAVEICSASSIKVIIYRLLTKREVKVAGYVVQVLYCVFMD